VCGTSAGDDAVFCDADGTRLLFASGVPTDIHDEETPALTLPPSFVGFHPTEPGQCTACGSTGADDGDGYCKICGHRIGHPATPPTCDEPSVDEPVTSLRAGLHVGAYTVLGPAARDDARAITPAGIEVLMLLGAPEVIAVEAEALEKLAGHRAIPRVLERGQKAPLAYLAVSTPPASWRLLADVVQNGGAAEAVQVLEALLDLAGEVELAGYSLHPAPRDLLIAPDGSIAVSRLRGAAKGRRVDARRLFESLGDVFLAAALLGPTRLVRLLVPHRDSEDSPARSIADMRSALDAVKRDLDAPVRRAHIAEVCDSGLWRPYNQDATALAEGLTPAGDPFTVMVVCDGVSSSSHSDLASTTAAAAACDALEHFALSPDIGYETPTEAVGQAIRAAHLAICAAHVASPVSDLPGTTVVLGFVHKKRLTVGWVGDSRAYWLTPRGAELLTHDHSWVNEAIARGEIRDASEVQGALAHTITKCLGPLEVGDVPMEIEPDIRSRELQGPGILLLCSDGLWNYAPDAEDIARVMRAAPDETDAAAVARLLVNYALARGGQDNVSVAVLAV
jgi:PPM family protein phosphatase